MFKTAKDGLAILGVAGGIAGGTWMGYRAAKDGSRELVSLINDRYEREQQAGGASPTTRRLMKTKNFMHDHKVAITFVSSAVLFGWIHNRSFKQFDMFLEEQGLSDAFYLADEIDEWVA